MILRATAKLSQKLKIKFLKNYETRVSAFEDWNGHLFAVNRVRYIFFTNAHSLLSATLPGKGISDTKTFIVSTNFWLSGVLRENGCEDFIGRFAVNDDVIVEVC